jgi:hypothetical protein
MHREDRSGGRPEGLEIRINYADLLSDPGEGVSFTSPMKSRAWNFVGLKDPDLASLTYISHFRTNLYPGTGGTQTSKQVRRGYQDHAAPAFCLWRPVGE